MSRQERVLLNAREQFGYTFEKEEDWTICRRDANGGSMWTQNFSVRLLQAVYPLLTIRKFRVCETSKLRKLRNAWERTSHAMCELHTTRNPGFSNPKSVTSHLSIATLGRTKVTSVKASPVEIWWAHQTVSIPWDAKCHESKRFRSASTSTRGCKLGLTKFALSLSF